MGVWMYLHTRSTYRQLHKEIASQEIVQQRQVGEQEEGFQTPWKRRGTAVVIHCWGSWTSSQGWGVPEHTERCVGDQTALKKVSEPREWPGQPQNNSESCWEEPSYCSLMLMNFGFGSLHLWWGNCFFNYQIRSHLSLLFICFNSPYEARKELWVIAWSRWNFFWGSWGHWFSLPLKCSSLGLQGVLRVAHLTEE